VFEAKLTDLLLGDEVACHLTAEGRPSPVAERRRVLDAGSTGCRGGVRDAVVVEDCPPWWYKTDRCGGRGRAAVVVQDGPPWWYSTDHRGGRGRAAMVVRRAAG